LGYALPRSQRRRVDLLDAVAAVQRRAPLFLVSESEPSVRWVDQGSLYLCRSARGLAEIAELKHNPWRRDSRWTGIVCFRGTVEPNLLYDPWLSEATACCLRYGSFALYGDPNLMREIQSILALEGLHPKISPIHFQQKNPSS
jgi:hypothetical protein